MANLGHVKDPGTDTTTGAVCLAAVGDRQRLLRSDEAYVEVTMRTLIRKVLLGVASVLALSVAGSIASSVVDYAANVGNTATAASMPAAVETSRDALTGDPLRRDDIRWAQVELRYRGLYQGSLDGVLGPETRHALSQFQQIARAAACRSPRQCAFEFP